MLKDRTTEATVSRAGGTGPEAAGAETPALVRREPSRQPQPLPEAVLSGIISLATDAIVSVDEDEHIILFNLSAEKIFGYGADEVLGRPLDILLPERLRASHRGMITSFGASAAVSRRMGERGEITGLRKSGEEFPAEASISKVDVDGRRVYTAVVRDITEQKAAAQELRLLQSLAFAIGGAEDLHDALALVLDQVCEVTGWTTGEAWIPNPAGTLLRRVAADRQPGTLLTEFHEASDDLCFARNEGLPGRVWAAAAPIWVNDVARDPNFVRADLARRLGLHGGVSIPVLADDAVVAVLAFYHREPRAADTRLVGMVSAVAAQLGSLVQRRRAEDALAKQAEALARSNAELERFAYVASHDLQEPLRMVASYTQLLARRYRGKLDADAEDFIGYAVEGVTRMQTLLNDLLTFSHVDSRGGSLEPTSSDAVLDRALRDLQPMVEENAAVISRDPLPEVHADAQQLEMVFENLIGNAIKFRREDTPRIHVGAARKGGNWVFSVRDNGIGIERDYYQRIFVLFQRLHTRAEYMGTGIGLAICKKIIERHGGRMWVESEFGRGSTFYFTLPCVN